MKLKITLIIFAGLAWANALIAVLAQDFWAKMFGVVCNKFDLTYAQGLLLVPTISITLCILTGISVAVFLVKSIKTKNLFSMSSENWAGLFCLSAFLFYTAVNIHGAPLFAQIMSNVQNERARQAVYETGLVQNGQYQNNSYGFGFQMPVGWARSSWATVQRKKVRATYSLFTLWNRNASVTNLIVHHIDGIDTVAAILKYASDNENYNPSLVVNRNDKQLMLEKYGVSNLVGFAEMLAKVPPPYLVDQSLVPEIIAGRTAIKLKIISMKNGFTISQKIFAFEVGSAYLEFVASTIDDGDASSLLACLNTLSFTK